MEVIDTSVVASVGGAEGAQIIELADGEAFLAAATGTDKDGHKIKVQLHCLLCQVAKTASYTVSLTLSIPIPDLDGHRRGPTGLWATEQQSAGRGPRGARQARRAQGRGHNREHGPDDDHRYHDRQLQRHHPHQPRPDLHQDHRHRELQRSPARDAEGHPQRHPQQRRRVGGVHRHRAQRRDECDDDGRVAAATATDAAAAHRRGAAHRDFNGGGETADGD